MSSDRTSKVTIATGEEFEMFFDFASGDWFEDRRGFALLPAFTEHFGTKTICWILLAGARKSRPKLSYEQMQEKLNDHLKAGGTLADLGEQVSKSLRRAGLLRARDSEGEGEEGWTHPQQALLPPSQGS